MATYFRYYVFYYAGDRINRFGFHDEKDALRWANCHSDSVIAVRDTHKQITIE